MASKQIITTPEAIRDGVEYPGATVLVLTSSGLKILIASFD